MWKSVEHKMLFSNEIARAQLDVNKKSFNDGEMKIDDDFSEIVLYLH
jgi:hypothetical protein